MCSNSVQGLYRIEKDVLHAIMITVSVCVYDILFCAVSDIVKASVVEFYSFFFF